MRFREATRSGFQNYVRFDGRAPRSAYWYWVLFTLIAAALAGILDTAVSIGASSRISFFSGLVTLGLLLPQIAVSVRRLHDRDKSGWFLLLCAIPLVGVIILIVWFCQRGTIGTNRFGADPLPG